MPAYKPFYDGETRPTAQMPAQPPTKAPDPGPRGLAAQLAWRLEAAQSGCLHPENEYFPSDPRERAAYALRQHVANPAFPGRFVDNIAARFGKTNEEN